MLEIAEEAKTEYIFVIDDWPAHTEWPAIKVNASFAWSACFTMCLEQPKQRIDQLIVTSDGLTASGCGSLWGTT